MYSTRSRALIWLTVIWLVVRIYPALMGWSSLAACGEAHSAVKLLEYGVQRLHGGVLALELSYGTVAHPERHIYTHHPYPIFWFYALVYDCFGFAGVSAVLYLLKYGALILCFLLLDYGFSKPSAFWASVLYAVAPVSMLCDGASNCVLVGSIFWPICLALIVFRFHRKGAASPGDLLLAGAATFLAGQVSWFALSIVPSLMVINSRLTSLKPCAIGAALANPFSLALLAGGCLEFIGIPRPSRAVCGRLWGADELFRCQGRRLLGTWAEVVHDRTRSGADRFFLGIGADFRLTARMPSPCERLKPGRQRVGPGSRRVLYCIWGDGAFGSQGFR